MGHRHPSRPVTKADKAMSKRHLKHRAEVDAMPEKTLDQEIEKTKVSIHYHHSHGPEHMKEGKKQQKHLKKLLKMKVKENK